MLHKIRCNPMHPLNDALPGLYVPVWVTRSALVAHQYTYAPPRWRISHCRRTFVPLWNDLADPVFDGVGLAGFKSRANDFLLAKAALSLLLVFYLSLPSVYRLVLWGWGLQTDRVYITLS